MSHSDDPRLRKFVNDSCPACIKSFTRVERQSMGVNTRARCGRSTRRWHTVKYNGMNNEGRSVLMHGLPHAIRTCDRIDSKPRIVLLKMSNVQATESGYISHPGTDWSRWLPGVSMTSMPGSLMWTFSVLLSTSTFSFSVTYARKKGHKDTSFRDSVRRLSAASMVICICSL